MPARPYFGIELNEEVLHQVEFAEALGVEEAGSPHAKDGVKEVAVVGFLVSGCRGR